jgi:plasmid stabilization system protein ParE
VARAVEWAGRAKSDLRLAVEYIRKESPEGAKAFLGQVFQATRSLSTFSERGRVVPDLNDPAVRQVLVGRYRVLYEVHPEAVWIMRVLHTSQDLLLALGRRTREKAERED